MGSITLSHRKDLARIMRTLVYYAVAVVALIEFCEAQFGGGVSIQNCVGSNCNSNNFFGRRRRQVLDEILKEVEAEEAELSREKRQAVQNCADSKCKQNNLGAIPRAPKPISNPVPISKPAPISNPAPRPVAKPIPGPQAVQNCEGSNCNQNNVGAIRSSSNSLPAPQPVPFPIPVSPFSAGFPFNGGFNLGGIPPVGFPTAGVPVGAQQNCVGSNCNQNNVGGGGFNLGGFPSVGLPTAGIPVGAQQNCVGSSCNQNNLGKKKREILDMVDELTKEAFDSEVGDKSNEREKREAEPQIQNCAFSNCNQSNFGRRKREVIAALLEELL